MDNIKMSFRRFFRNKNTVTIVGVILILGILYWGYSSQITNSVKPQKVPVAATTIQPRTEITEAMVTTIEMPSVSVKDNVFRYTTDVVGKYSNINALIPEGSMFYKQQIVNQEDLPDAAFVEVEEGEVPYSLPVTMETTYGNSIAPGNKIDIWMKAVDNTGKVMVGKLIKNVKVLAVKDSQGRNVFENTETAGTPSTMIFGLNPQLYILLKKASYMSTFSVELFPVPVGLTLDDDAVEEGSTVDTYQLKDFINANTVVIEGQDITTTEKDESSNTTNKTTSTKEKE